MSEIGDPEERNLNLVDEEEQEDEEDEDEDVDFNPFLKECSSPEASSSISSDDDVEKFASNSVERLQNSDGERREKRKFVSEDLEECSGSENRVVVEEEEEENSNERIRGFDVNVAVNMDEDEEDEVEEEEEEEEDAICRRTRARYSLANCTLDELETFLQETDDDEDLHYVDDEQEYKKFLTAVLHGGENDDQSLRENENVDDDDDDEDSDVDFEIELEEALDSDLDENVQEEKKEGRRGGRRPKTRDRNSNKMFLGQANKPLRPLVPIPSPTCFNLQRFTPNSFLNCPPASQSSQVIGFTPHQIGQLHCLIHEHTQLLVQIFSLSILDPSHQSIADETRGLLSELVHRRNKTLSWRKVPYPDYCFRPPYIHSSVSEGFDGTPYIYSLHVPVDSTSALQHVGGRRIDGPHVNYTKDTVWVPQGGPVVSILDAAPLSLVERYMDDVSRVVQDYQKRHVEGMYYSRLEKAPLFPIPNTLMPPGPNNEALRSASIQSSTLPSSLNVDQLPKKSLAAALIESSKQSIAFVPKEIATLAQRFYAFFNPALYPHKPPLAPLAKRVYFTDSEDKLLAMGIMEYNTNWEAIKQRFLPCKSNHQIFVRQKNRCSSRSPDNPIKAVRQMKTSPLTAEEKGRIFQGLKIFKNDWVAVGKFMVPYRDPTLLPRQWRIAIGTQKSYKSDEAKRKKRHLYEIQKRLRKTPSSADCQTAYEKEDNVDNDGADESRSDNDGMEDEDEAYVHEAFLADWRPENSRSEPLEIENSCASQVQAGESNGRLPSESRNSPSSVMSQHLQNVAHLTHARYTASHTVASKDSNPDSLPKPSKSQVKSPPRGVTRKKDSRLVKLAPDLPPLNLPSSVRVISQSAFSSYRSAACHPNTISNTSVEREKYFPTVPRVAKSGTAVTVDSVNKGSNVPTVPRVAKSGTADSVNKGSNVSAVPRVAKSGTAVAVDSVNKGSNVSAVPRVAKSGTAVAVDSVNKGSNVSAVPRVAKSGAAVAVDSVNKGSNVPTVPPVAKAGTVVSVDSGNNESIVPPVLHVAKSGTAVPMGSGNKAKTPIHSTASLRPEDRRVNSDQVTTKDNMFDATFQMHPLLLRAPEDGHFPYFPVNLNACASNTFNFIEGNQLQANFNLFGKPPDADSTIDASLSLSNSSRSCTIDFHPLLQRYNNGNFGQHQHSSESGMIERHVTSGTHAASVPVSPNEVDDELDLEMHLSSTSRKRKLKTGGKVTAHNFEGLLNLGIIKETNKVDSVSEARNENLPTSSLAASSRNQEHLVGNHVLVSSNNTSRFVKDHALNQSLPEIIMEQEELSDSEEEKGEDVEFECEEMDDSEREE